MRKTLRAGFAALLAVSSAGPAVAADHPAYNFSPVNQYNLQVSASFWNPIIRYVSNKSGVRLNLKLGRTSADTTSFILAREVDFAFTNHLFSPERAKMGWSVFGRRDADPVRAQIVVPADSPVQRLEELAGSTVAFPGPEALVAYKVTYAELLRRKIPVTVAFAGNMDAAFTQLASGRARAAGANSQLVQNYGGREDQSFRVLWSSAPFNDLALMASSRVPAAQVRAVAAAFLGMGRDPEGRRILDAATALIHAPQPVGFVAATEADYAAYRLFYQAAPAELR
ncbi:MULTISPECIES: phosphate/phosphite/phosphonate ABC transporter substrate-binding protein [unclassified Massilia]|uniref:phosphate/phosphite/phosphonate ABC transporter substrate-binding protein n=1 Tax=unclassified Massilia TaxID=2609279 RepID=UPI00177B1E96|nr:MULTISPECIES: PhnD/SsuA/transferrin family substrate-binding protein [unclassified Massilia]MBD8530192.1 PhnD/SsuA/transferrin family substrate-binding protein [Massilia sp. CFBP 13647]MBD8673979.1 PhnD/SsuA/transferrin family substrate-binding protein [Massilia sp. CFBP 13721]